MDDQKIENLLNLALDASQQEREKSESLEVGYDAAENRWEVIIRYSGDFLQVLRPLWDVVLLSGGYAIVTLPEQEIDVLAALPQVEYVEKPKRLYFSVDAGRAASCISALQTPQMNLFGEGVLVAVLDSGVDYFHPDFRNEDGSTRILALWDQTAVQTTSSAGRTAEHAEARAPEGFVIGGEYTKADLDEALAAGSQAAGYAIVPERDESGHGTQVLGIAAGNGRASGGQYRGVAPESELIVVKLGTPRAGGFPRTTELMQAVEYVYRKAAELGRPMAVNMSFGNVYGSHRGTSLLETYIDMMAARGRSVIAVGTGNEGNSGGHASGRLQEGTAEEIELFISDFETTVNLQIWKNYADEYRISVIAPDGEMTGPFGREIGASRYRLANTDLLVYYGEPSPYQSQQEIYLDFIPQRNWIDSGVWRIVLTPQRIVTGTYELWLNDSRARNAGTRFVHPSPDATLTIPSSASQVIAVGAYDARRNAYASFSGRGWPDVVYGIRPDLAAPGVDITTTTPGGGYQSVTGTSFAAPFVTGAAALMMQWGERVIIMINFHTFLPFYIPPGGLWGEKRSGMIGKRNETRNFYTEQSLCQSMPKIHLCDLHSALCGK